MKRHIDIIQAVYKIAGGDGASIEISTDIMANNYLNANKKRMVIKPLCFFLPPKGTLLSQPCMGHHSHGEHVQTSA